MATPAANRVVCLRASLRIGDTNTKRSRGAPDHGQAVVSWDHRSKEHIDSIGEAGGPESRPYDSGGLPPEGEGPKKAIHDACKFMRGGGDGLRPA